MGALVITCPATGKQVETGIETDTLSLELTPQFVGRTHCPHCAAEHTFSKEQAFVCEMVDGVMRYMRAA
ncbi:MAG: hypothetical protein AB7K04_01170 [Pseudorhodoplanes sp.]